MSRGDYSDVLRKATQVALSDIAKLVGSSSEAVIVGGLAPQLHFPLADERFVGTGDINVLLSEDFGVIEPMVPLHSKLAAKGFEPDPLQPHRYFRCHQDGPHLATVIVEFLSPDRDSVGGLRRIPKEEIYAVRHSGLEKVFEHPVLCRVDDRHSVQVCDLATFFVLKSMVFDNHDPQRQAKDAYDLLYCLRMSCDGGEGIAEELLSRASDPFYRAGIDHLLELFDPTDGTGLVAYARWCESGEEHVHLLDEGVAAAQRFVSHLAAVRA